MKLKEGRLSLSYKEQNRSQRESYQEMLGTDENRPVPLPREFIKTLARVSTGSHIVVGLAHFMRCLFIDRGKVNTTGFVKASFITKLTGICERAIHAARSWLRRKGFIQDKEVAAKVSRRWGGCFSIILPLKSQKKPTVKDSTYAQFAPLGASSPYIRNNDLNIQYGTKKQKSFFSGIFRQKEEEQKVILSDIKPENLKSLPDLNELYTQAVEKRWFKHTENQPLEFLSAAVRAISTPARDSVRVFVSLVKRRLTSHITQAQESRAQTKLSKFRRHHPEAFTGTRLSNQPISE